MNKAFERCFVVSIVYTLRSVPYIWVVSKANLLVFLPICTEKNPIETFIFVLINILNFYQLY